MNYSDCNCEDKPCCGCGSAQGSDENEAHDSMREQAENAFAEDEEREAHAGWPGSGDGSDDLADFNQLEALDYADE